MQKYDEDLEIYDLEGKFLNTQNRDDFYKEIKEEYEKCGIITRQVKNIRLMLMTSAGRIYVQKRSKEKSENAGLYDKTVGGHVSAGQNWDVTVVLECHQELGFPIVVLPEKQFEQAVKVTDLSIIGMAKLVDHVENYQSVRKTPKGHFIQPIISNFYLGYYDGAIWFKDGESTGVEVFELKELKEAVVKEPEKFTEDIKMFINSYGHLLVPLIRKK